MSRTSVTYGPDFQRVLEYAAYDCAQTGSASVGVDHLLLGLYREDFPLIDEVLASFRVDSMVVLDRLLSGHPEAESQARPEDVVMSPEAVQAVDRAEQEARRLGHELLAAPHALLGVLSYNRENLGRYFLRERIYLNREEAVLEQVRQMVRWLRFETPAGTEREIHVLDPETVVGLESVRLTGRDRKEIQAFAVRLRMLKTFRKRS